MLREWLPRVDVEELCQVPYLTAGAANSEQHCSAAARSIAERCWHRQLL